MVILLRTQAFPAHTKNKRGKALPRLFFFACGEGLGTRLVVIVYMYTYMDEEGSYTPDCI